jgi:hypothetical protein
MRVHRFKIWINNKIVLLNCVGSAQLSSLSSFSDLESTILRGVDYLIKVLVLLVLLLREGQQIL